MKCPGLILQLTLRQNCGWLSCFSAPLIRRTILKTRSKHNDHKLRVALVVTAADLHKVVMVVHLSKPMVSRRAGMDSPPLARDNMGSLLRARDNMGSSQVPMVDHHQTNLLTVDSRAGILLRRL